MVLAVCKVLAVLALPFSAAVTVPAEKLPLASLATVALAVFASVALVAELATFPDVDIVASIALDTLPVSPVVISVPLVFGRVYVLVVAALMLLASNVAFFVLSASSWKACVRHCLVGEHLSPCQSRKLTVCCCLGVASAVCQHRC